MFCPNCGHNGLEFMFTDYEKSTNTVIRQRRCPSCGKEYTTYEMIIDEQKALHNKLEYLKDRDNVNKRIILKSRNELRGLINKLEQAKRLLDSVVIEDIDE